MNGFAMILVLCAQLPIHGPSQRGNAVPIAPHEAVSVHHIVERQLGSSLITVREPFEVFRIDHRAAVLLSDDEDLTVWSVDGTFPDIVQISEFDAHPGQRGSHLWFDFAGGHVREKQITFVNADHIIGECRPGMSGSGVYSTDGKLLGLVTLSDGTIVPASKIRAAVERLR